MRRSTKLSMAILAAALFSGCAIHSQAPIREVAYDFSDFEFYDRAYAASPEYEDAAVPQAAALGARSAPSDSQR